MPRELWKGAIQFGLVHIPVALHPAERREELAFAMLDRSDLQPVGNRRYNKTTGDEVPFERIVKGYELTKGRYVTLEKEDFKRANVEATQTVDIMGFVDREQLPAYFFDAPYYLAPAKQGAKGYALLRETLVRSGRVGIATVVIRTRAHLAALYPVDNVLVLNTLRYANELRDPSELDVPADLKAAKVTARETDMAERLVADMSMDWDPASYHDSYREDLLKLIEQKAAGRVKSAPRTKQPRSAEVVDLVALLERSLAGERKEPAAERGPKAANDEHHRPRRKAAAAKPRRKAAPPRTGNHRRAA